MSENPEDGVKTWFHDEGFEPDEMQEIRAELETLPRTTWGTLNPCAAFAQRALYAYDDALTQEARR